MRETHQEGAEHEERDEVGVGKVDTATSFLVAFVVIRQRIAAHVFAVGTRQHHLLPGLAGRRPAVGLDSKQFVLSAKHHLT